MISDFDIECSKRLTVDPQAAHGVAFLVPDETPEPYPHGFWNSESRSGRPRGQGFYCHYCHLLYIDNAPSRIRHCGSYEILNPKKQLVTHRIGSYVAYPPVGEKELPVLEQIKTGHTDVLQPSPSLFRKAKDFVVRWLT